VIDIGVNLTNSRFDKDREYVISNAKQAGIKHILITGTSVEESLKAAQFAKVQPDYLSSTAGVHPHDADNVEDNYLEQLFLLAQQPYVKAIGECGLDFNRNFSAPKQQIAVFQAQVELAQRLSLPLFLHQRDAFDPWFDMLTPALGKIPMVAHCFTGNKEELVKCVDAGMYIGITGWVCDDRRGHDLQEAVKYLPLERLMVETDAPYLTPRTIKPKPKSSRNEPKYLPYVVDMIARLKDVTSDQVIETSMNNAKQVFDLC